MFTIIGGVLPCKSLVGEKKEGYATFATTLLLDSLISIALLTIGSLALTRGIWHIPRKGAIVMLTIGALYSTTFLFSTLIKPQYLP